MATFGSNNETNENNEKQQEGQQEREFIGCFSERKGKFGTFYKAIIDGFEYYLSETLKPDKHGNKQLKLQKSREKSTYKPKS